MIISLLLSQIKMIDPKPDIQIEVNKSMDSIIHVVKNDLPIPNSVPLYPFYDYSFSVIQELSPLTDRLGDEANRGIAWYVHKSVEMSKKGICTLNNKYDFYVVPKEKIKFNDSPALKSYYVPGPSLSTYLHNLKALQENQINNLEAQEQNALKHLSSSQIHSLISAYDVLKTNLLQVWEHTMLDPANIKVRWDVQNSRYLLIVTDIQQSIGHGYTGFTNYD